MSKQVFFYQNNPCVIVRDVNEDFAEVQISHHFAESMELTGHCQGCCVGDSDNKLSCTCDEFSWIIEEFQSEENKIIAMVEKRLLLDSPIEKASIDKLEKEIEERKVKLQGIKDLHGEWELSLKSIKQKHEALTLQTKLLELKLSGLNNLTNEMIESNDRLQKKRESILVEINDYSVAKNSIPIKELDRLRGAAAKLEALEKGGVDNWEWYDESLKNAGFN